MQQQAVLLLPVLLLLLQLQCIGTSRAFSKAFVLLLMTRESRCCLLPVSLCLLTGDPREHNPRCSSSNNNSNSNRCNSSSSSSNSSSSRSSNSSSSNSSSSSSCQAAAVGAAAARAAGASWQRQTLNPESHCFVTPKGWEILRDRRRQKETEGDRRRQDVRY